MPYKILPTKEFEKDFKKVEIVEQRRIKSKFEEVALNPERYKHLQYELRGSCRIRIGKLRVIYSYDEDTLELYLEKIVFDHKYR
ncbi:type II toxin-antitoxin system RelE/ParE family toxin [Candidatus Woesearchaeota archaeon]|nr:type II toxin-antitoxin system RelE/ParE family toxin [Candidatus Woesearchaeota archaeon]